MLVGLLYISEKAQGPDVPKCEDLVLMMTLTAVKCGSSRSGSVVCPTFYPGSCLDTLQYPPTLRYSREAVKQPLLQ